MIYLFFLIVTLVCIFSVSELVILKMCTTITQLKTEACSSFACIFLCCGCHVTEGDDDYVRACVTCTAPQRGLYLEFISPNILNKNVPWILAICEQDFFPQLSQLICLFNFVRRPQSTETPLYKHTLAWRISFIVRKKEGFYKNI